jgi:hypothetical protein
MAAYDRLHAGPETHDLHVRRRRTSGVAAHTANGLKSRAKDTPTKLERTVRRSCTTAPTDPRTGEPMVESGRGSSPLWRPATAPFRSRKPFEHDRVMREQAGNLDVEDEAGWAAAVIAILSSRRTPRTARQSLRSSCGQYHAIFAARQPMRDRCADPASRADTQRVRHGILRSHPRHGAGPSR